MCVEGGLRFFIFMTLGGISLSWADIKEKLNETETFSAMVTSFSLL